MLRRGRLLLISLIVIGATFAVSNQANAGTVVRSFTVVGEDTFTVPDGINSLHVDAIGGKGGNLADKASEVVADIPSTPGDTLFVEVGGDGTSGTGVPGVGGSNGGADGAGTGTGGAGGGGGGGGASDIRTCSTTQPSCTATGDASDPRILVAGGSGGGDGGFDSTGGAGGNGADPGCNAGGDGGSSQGSGGQGGGCSLALPGGLHGAGALSGHDGTDGSPGSGGTGGDNNCDGCAGGGGGGGGYFGGGGGGGCGCIGGGAGGGGSSFVEPGASNVTMSTTTARASVTISYTTTVPGKPSSVIASRHRNTLLVHWLAPSTGGLPIKDYTVESTPSGVLQVVSGSQTVARFTHMTRGVRFTFTVTARNDDGYGPTSIASNPVRRPRPRRR